MSLQIIKIYHLYQNHYQKSVPNIDKEINKNNINNNNNNESNNKINIDNNIDDKNNIIVKDDGDELESDEEQDIQDLNSLKDKDKVTLKDLIKYKDDTDDLSQEQLTKINDLKASTENIISKTVKVRNKKNIVKALVSKKKEQILL